MSTEVATDLAAWLTAIWDEREEKFAEACEAEAENLRNDGMPDTTAEEIREFWLGIEGNWWRLDAARIAADRQILEEFTKEQWVISQGHCSAWTEGGQAARLTVLKHLASIYADRPGYQQEWKP